MILTRTFEWGDHEEFGHGWITQGMPGFDPVNGSGAAHDTLEHFDSDTSLESEFQAFGCILWGRVLGGYWHQYTHSAVPPEKHLSYDIVRFLAENRLKLRDPEPSRKTAVLEDEGAEEELQKVIQLAREKLPQEYNDFHGEPPDLISLEETLYSVRAWIRIGFRRAERRFSKHLDPYEFSYLFHRVEEEFDRRSKGGDYGEWIRVRVDTKTQEIRITRKESWE